MRFEDLSGYHVCHIDDKKPGSILREQRVIQNLTQQQVADKAEITLQQYQKFESSSRNIRTASFQIACRVLRALNMDIEKFFDGEYCIGEEYYIGKDGKWYYKKTGREVDADVDEQ